jgi:arylsulfatase A-like enzyme
MIKWPEVTNGDKTSSLAGLIDLYPTLCDMANLSVPNHVEGTSLTPILKDPNTSVKDAVFTQWFNSYSMRTDRYRFIKHYKPRKIHNADKDTMGIYEIYDHKTDPQENINKAYKTGNDELLHKLKKKMKDEGHYEFN